MTEYTIKDVIRILSTDELEDALEAALEAERSALIWQLLDEMERREPRFEL